MKAHLRAPFGTVAIFRDPNPTGDSPAMGELGLVLYRDSGGSVVAYLLDRGITVSRMTFKTVSISDSVLAHLRGLARDHSVGVAAKKRRGRKNGVVRDYGLRSRGTLAQGPRPSHFSCFHSACG
jgi:hypothetical protein